MALFYDWLGPKTRQGIRLAVMDMWKPFRNVTAQRAPKAAMLFDKFHIIMRHLGEALDATVKDKPPQGWRCAPSLTAAARGAPRAAIGTMPRSGLRRPARLPVHEAGSGENYPHDFQKRP
jgi:hypothetical protein